MSLSCVTPQAFTSVSPMGENRRKVSPTRGAQMTRRMRALAFLTCACLMPAFASAQYPNKPVRIVVPFAPGGTADVMARVVAPVLTQSLGVPIIVENKPRAGGGFAVDTVAKAAPDGYPEQTLA